MKRRDFLVASAAAAALAACSSENTNAAVPTAAKPSAKPSAKPGSVSTRPGARTSGNVTAPAPGTATATTVLTTPTTNRAKSLADYVNHGPRTAKTVALTFHVNGDPALATAMLDELDATKTFVTAFLVGTFVDANHRIVKRLIDSGHAIGNHTWSHQLMRNLSAKQLDDEIVRGRNAIATVAGSHSPWFRPSGIEVPTDGILKAAARAGYTRSIGYDTDPLDYQDPGTKAIVAEVSANAQGGSIVSMHFGHRGSIDAIKPITKALRNKGFEFVTLDTMLA